MNPNLARFVENRDAFFVQQIKEWLEIFTNWETRNKYEILDKNGHKLGYMAERGGGLLKTLGRLFLRSHRPMHVDVWDDQNHHLLSLERPFFWIWSDMNVTDPEGNTYGHVYRRFAFIYRVYDLTDGRGKVFARIKSPFWRLWTFPLKDVLGNEIGAISKNWGGLLKEVFTDTDRFQVSFKNLDDEQRVVAFAAAVAIDMDFFEENHDRN